MSPMNKESLDSLVEKNYLHRLPCIEGVYYLKKDDCIIYYFKPSGKDYYRRLEVKIKSY